MTDQPPPPPGGYPPPPPGGSGHPPPPPPGGGYPPPPPPGGGYPPRGGGLPAPPPAGRLSAPAFARWLPAAPSRRAGSWLWRRLRGSAAAGRHRRRLQVGVGEVHQ